MAKRIIIERFCDSDKMGVFGEVLIDGVHQCYTVEQPWNDNIPFESCVPAGDYELVGYDSPKYGRTYALKNLALDVGVFEQDARRYACLIHSANLADELQGCIACGVELGVLHGLWSVGMSRRATKSLLNKIKSGDQLTIIWKDHP